MPGAGVVGLLVAGASLLLAPAARSEAPRWPSAAAERYEEGRRLMQQGRYAEASEAYRSVADWPAGGDFPERAQALFASGLMQSSAREYERALGTYREVMRRFPGTDFARRAATEVKALEEGGAARAIAVQRKLDAARDELFPAEERVERDGLAAGRAGLVRAVRLLEEILRDDGDHPKAREVALTLGDAHMTLRDHRAARDAYGRALALLQGDRNAVVNAEQKLADAVRWVRRDRVRETAWTLLTAIGVGLLAVRPWRGLDRRTLLVGGLLVSGTIGAALLAAAGAAFIRTYVDDHSPVEDRVAALLVLLPGVAGQVVALGFASGLARGPATSGGWRTGIAALLGAVAALAVVACVVYAFELFPLLDSEL
jgi:outer membrane protein assembly factor BamD (BamD/ComL family)